MLPDRNRRARGYPWLEWKVRFFVIGAMLALGGMAMSLPWLVWAATFFLALGFLIRFLPRGRGTPAEEEEEGEEVEPDPGTERDWWASGS